MLQAPLWCANTWSQVRIFYDMPFGVMELELKVVTDLVCLVTEEVNFLKVVKISQAVSLVPALRENLFLLRLKSFNLLVDQQLNKQRTTLPLTSKLICPPIENVRLRWANFSRRMETIFGRMLWIWNIMKVRMHKQRHFNNTSWVSESHTLSYFSNSSLSSWLQLRPIGETLIIPLRNSMNVPLQKDQEKVVLWIN